MDTVITEPTWEEKYTRLNESLAKNKRLFSSEFAQKVIKNQVKRIEKLEEDLIAKEKERGEAVALLSRIARKGEFMDMEGQRLVVSDWLARRHITTEK